MSEKQPAYEAAHVGTESGVPDAVLIGLRWAEERTESWSQLTVVAPTRRHFDDDPTLSRLPKGVRQETHQTLRSWTDLTPVVVACWPDERTLQLLDSTHIKALCVIPWVPGEIDTWRLARHATDLLGDTTSDYQPAIDPVVVEALRSLTDRVNLSTGLGHPSDRSSAISMFRILKNAGYPWEPRQIQIWAMQNGWKSKDAAELAETSQGVLEGKAFKNVRTMWADDILDIWSTKTEK